MADRIELQDLKGKKKATEPQADSDSGQSVSSTDANFETYDNSVANWAYGSAALYVVH